MGYYGWDDGTSIEQSESLKSFRNWLMHMVVEEAFGEDGGGN